jgi:hypothetical protein
VPAVHAAPVLASPVPLIQGPAAAPPLSPAPGAPLPGALPVPLPRTTLAEPGPEIRSQPTAETSSKADGTATPEPGVWSSFFDGEEPRRAKRSRLSVDAAVSLKESLALARPFRTRRQLERLAREPRRPEESFSFAVIGDAEPGRFWLFRKLFNVPGVFKRLVRQVEALPVDFTIQLGDMVSRGTPRNFHRFFRELTSLNPSRPYLTIIGNHDRRSPHGVTDSVVYRSHFGQTNYAFERGGTRFIVLDTSTGRLRSAQLRWLEASLQTEKRKIVFTHMPPSPLRSFTGYPGFRGLGGFSHGARALTDLLSREKVERVYLGHVHGFGVQDYKGVRYVLTGGGGSPLYPSLVKDRFHHFLEVTVGPEGISETVHRLDGSSYRP